MCQCVFVSILYFKESILKYVFDIWYLNYLVESNWYFGIWNTF